MNENYFPITTYGMPILRQVTYKVTEIDSKLIENVQRMFLTMLNADGIGLAAPQVNLDHSFAVIDISMIEEFQEIKPFTMINPVIISKEGSIILEEGCLSIPGIRAEIERPEKIFVKYTDLSERDVELEADNLLARVIQHEIDHLSGKLFTDYLTIDQKRQLKDSLDEIKNGKVTTRYPLLIHSR
ncbi:peptide deformylase [Ignavibacteria bacterium CHB1]|nr:MAG: peptide deformylase [Chlorobiota bacterium]MBV6398492.1 Peptide deformylase [Ignavibacteria bacterium]MCC6885726.1 peptide deformylase [Ignavibacteriales bacterium]MCE7953079.1 peptide deformylase [Chlorobi bacterium CHB7]MDL1887083.1 peptide deformylase [Ignavibacteria bacterium CHB1]RIK49894.1 MAG: peptide deformylase [Ignavibacteriota bacterium]